MRELAGGRQQPVLGQLFGTLPEAVAWLDGARIRTSHSGAAAGRDNGQSRISVGHQGTEGAFGA